MNEESTANMPVNVPETITEETPKFKGYSIEDLRYRRALVALQKQFAKEKIFNDVNKIQRHSPFSKDFAAGETKISKMGAIAGKLLNGFNYLDYAMLGFTVFNSGRKIFKIFRGRRK